MSDDPVVNDMTEIVDMLVKHTPETAIAIMAAILVSCCLHLPDPEVAMQQSLTAIKYSMKKELEEFKRESETGKSADIIKLFG